MCGIVGQINLPITPKMMSLLRHRGPDSQGICRTIFPKHVVSFGHTRLAIQDLTINGHQPMTIEDERFVLVFNGEIYNHFDLRKKMNGVEFRSHSDSETLFWFLILFGTERLHEINGIFAFSFLDKEAHELTIARDRFGVKPLYYTQKGNQLVFSSELKWIRRAMPELNINRQALYSFLRLRYTPSPLTMLDETRKVCPGQAIQWDLSTPDLKRKEWMFPGERGAKISISKKEALQQYEHLLEQSVSRQLLSDVPIALMLSGGVDSALLGSFTKRQTGKEMVAYTAGFDKSYWANELDDAEETAKYLGFAHRKVEMTSNDFFSTLRHLVGIVEEPLGSSSILPTYFLTQRMHQDGFKVAMSGQGVDELWGGYFRYKALALMGWLPNTMPESFNVLRKVFPGDGFRRGLNAMQYPDPIGKLIESYSLFDSNMLNQIFRGGVAPRRHQDLKSLVEHRINDFGLKNDTRVETMMGLDLRMNLADDLLLYTDKISMHHSMEIRVPFLDNELVNFVESLPLSYKMNLRQNKILHKKLALKTLPSSIVNRKKKGFYIPLEEWYKSRKSKEVLEDICSDRGWFNNHFDQKAIRRLFMSHQKGTNNNSKQLFLVSVLFYWIREMELGTSTQLVPPAWEYAA